MVRLCATIFTLLLIAFGTNPTHAQETLPVPQGVAASSLDLPKEIAPPPKDGAAPCANGGFDFKKVPPVRIFPRLGFFPILPTGPGYYSLFDQIHGELRDKAPKFGYPPFAAIAFSFFDADFRYLDDPKNKDHDWSDAFHRVHLGDNWLFNTGGQVWWRHMAETNARLTNKDNDYDLFRVRTYTDLWYQDKVRMYVEFISAQSFNQELAPLPIDRNFSDLLNAFMDFKLPCIGGDYPGYLRIGRQELLLGSERLISPLDWANTRRTFEGVRAFRQGEKFDVDVFWLQPVIPNATRFDMPDHRVNFGGVWTTYRPEKGQFFDLYYLYLDNANAVTQQRLVRAPETTHTFGTRYVGDKNQWLWDVEAALQLGSQTAARSVCAGMATVGGGYNFKNLPMNPTFWLYYDYASGDRSPNVGDLGTFNQQFPFGHYYMGWGDWVGRQNIHDFNAHLYLYPTHYLTVWLQYHRFLLASSRDALYSPAGTVSKFDPTGQFGNDVGQELDLVTNVHIDKHQDLMVGYSRLFAGPFLLGVGPANGADLFYAMYSFRW